MLRELRTTELIIHVKVRLLSSGGSIIMYIGEKYILNFRILVGGVNKYRLYSSFHTALPVSVSDSLAVC